MMSWKRFVPAMLLVGVAAGWGMPLYGQAPSAGPASTVDHRYAPVWWQTSICLPDDWQKTLVGKEGTLLYDYPGTFTGFKTRIGLSFGPEAKWVRQELVGPQVPIVRTIKQSGKLEIAEEAFAAAPPLRWEKTPTANPLRHDLVLARLRNTGLEGITVRPEVTVGSELVIAVDPAGHRVKIGPATTLFSPAEIRPASASAGNAVGRAGRGGKVVLQWPALHIPAGEERTLALGVLRGPQAPRPDQLYPISADQAQQLEEIARQYWKKADLPYGCFEVPDAGIQAQLDSSIRNIYQAREIKKGLPAFQVGPTCYRGLWVVDGSFLMEAVAYLGRVEEARNGIRYLLSFQRPDGAVMLIDGHLKETGIALWAVTRHARLTGDKAWLAEVWPQIEKGFAYIRTMRDQASTDPKAPNYRLLPEGFSDGGLGGKNPEYTNVYWTLAGLKAAVEAARWLGKNDQAGAWQKEYDDFYAAFRRAAERDTRTDAHGNRYVPISMRKDAKISPQKAQWAFLHAVFPGKVFAPDDPLVRGNMAMLRAAEAEGLVRDTGWVQNGVWNYFASFYAHAWLWLGHGRKAGQTLYDFANHASPLLVWREEQMPVGEGDAVCGDMPHNWASAEFIRLVRDLLILERGDELHLFEGLPTAWIRPGKAVRVRGAVTEFGPISLEFRVAADGAKATLVLDPPARTPPKRIVVHQSAWSGKPETFELSPQGRAEREIRLKN